MFTILSLNTMCPEHLFLLYVEYTLLKLKLLGGRREITKETHTWYSGVYDMGCSLNILRTVSYVVHVTYLNVFKRYDSMCCEHCHNNISLNIYLHYYKLLVPQAVCILCKD